MPVRFSTGLYGRILPKQSVKELLNIHLLLLKDKPSFHINFIMNVSPNCDCWGFNDYPLVPDLGIAASFDPGALDQACADMVKAAPALPGSKICDDQITVIMKVKINSKWHILIHSGRQDLNMV